MLQKDTIFTDKAAQLERLKLETLKKTAKDYDLNHTKPLRPCRIV